MRRLTAILPFAALFVLTCRNLTPPPPVIIISVDTLRSDRLPMFGYHGVATPALDRLRSDGILFTNAWSHSPLTLPSHATILSGMLPSRHGVRDNTGFRLPETVVTLPEILRKQGYATGAAISAYVLRKATRLDRGFDWYDDQVDRSPGQKSLGAVQRAGEVTAEIAGGWISRHADRPFFFLLHLYEPHAPYTAPAAYRTASGDAYDAEIAHADAIIGRFLDSLRKQGIYDRALIIFTSDHGEGLGDHGEDEHGIFLYREALAVPLVIKLPDQRLAGTTEQSLVGLMDLAPTVLEVAGVSGLSEVDGVSLTEGQKLASLPARSIYSETYYPRFHFGWSELHSLVDATHHFIDAPRDELYELDADRSERRNVIESNRRRYSEMRSRLAKLTVIPAAPSPVSAEEAQKLAALGYIGSSTAATGGSLADPKDKIETFRALQAAFRLYQERKDAEAVVAFDRLLKNEPEMVDLWDVRSKALFRLGRTTEGIESAKQALRLNPSASHIAADLANEMLLAGDTEGARQHAELALGSDPAKAHEILARVSLAKGDLAAAEQHARDAVAAAGSGRAALHTLAIVQQKRSDWRGVVATTDLVLNSKDKTPPMPGIWLVRGDALARLGRTSEAESAFRNEIRVSPSNVEAYRALALLLVSANRVDDATRVVMTLAEASPNSRTYILIADMLRVIGDDDGVRYWSARARAASSAGEMGR